MLNKYYQVTNSRIQVLANEVAIDTISLESLAQNNEVSALRGSADDPQPKFLVVVNEEEQYAIWPHFKPLPGGWSVCSANVNEVQAQEWIESNWPDVRPLSLRKTIPSPDDAFRSQRPLAGLIVSRDDPVSLSLAKYSSKVPPPSTATDAVRLPQSLSSLLPKNSWERVVSTVAAFEYALMRVSGEVDFVLDCVLPKTATGGAIDIRTIRCLVVPGATYDELRSGAHKSLRAPTNDVAAPIRISFAPMRESSEIDLCFTSPTVELRYDSTRVTHQSAKLLAEYFLETLRVSKQRSRVPLAILLPGSAPRPRPIEESGQARPCITDRIRQSTLRRPEALAVEAPDGRFTYEQLDRRVRLFKDRLIRKGIRRGDSVAVCVPRTSIQLVAILSVLEIGASYIPLDEDQPIRRRQAILDDASPTATIGGSDLHSKGIRLGLEMDVPASDDTISPDATLFESGWSNEIAYTIYTSGSTGQPKGVMVHHAALATLIDAMISEMTFDETDKLLAVTTVSFDIAQAELLLPLAVGGTVVLATSRQARDPRALAELGRSAGVTVLQATPVTWQLLTQLEETSWLPIRGLCGGETLPVQLAAKVARRTGRLWNVYGPTESTIWCTSFLVDELTIEDVPIGAALPGTAAYVLDPELNLSPVGCPGELYVGGGGVATGYLGLGGLTAARFLPNPFGPPGSRMYRTGDIVRLSESGQLQFLGRRDDQVKIRGHRVELSEIIRRLMQHPDVTEATAIVVDQTTGRSALCAFVAASTTAQLNLRTWVGETLPEYMVPARIYVLENLPRSISGKVDRAKLIKYSYQEGVSSRSSPRVSNQIEERICRIFADVLDLTTVQPGDDFIELGGDSLLALELITRINTQLRVELQLQAVFETPTPAAIARGVELFDCQSLG